MVTTLPIYIGLRRSRAARSCCWLWPFEWARAAASLGQCRNSRVPGWSRLRLRSRPIGALDQAHQLAARNSNTRLVIDHLGLPQPQQPPLPPAPFDDLPRLLALAPHDNVAVKISGACTLSREPFPYKDIWDPLRRIFDAFGFDRCMWGTDWTRAVKLLTYKQGVEAFRVTDRLSDSERTALMGDTLQRVYDWHSRAS
jgi:predicted TIM-barrel fold metal-dependent hydrolase